MTATPWLLVYQNDAGAEWYAPFIRELSTRTGLTARMWVIGGAERELAERTGAYAGVADLLDGYDASGADAAFAENLALIVGMEEAAGRSFYQEDLAIDRYRELRGWSDVQAAHLTVHLVRRMRAELSACGGVPVAAFGENNMLAYRLAHHLLPGVPYWHPSPVRHWDHRLFLDHEQSELWPRCQELYAEMLRTGVPEELREKALARLHEIRDRQLGPLAFRRFGARRGTDPFAEKLRLGRAAGVVRRWWAARRSGDPASNPFTLTASHLSPVRKLVRTGVETWRKRAHDAVALPGVPEGRKFATYFLQVQPEHSVEGQAFLYRNQVALLENVAAALPADVLLVVKEHRPMLGMRAAAVHRRIAALPNTVLVSDTIPSFELIKRSEVVFTLSGSAALEAMYVGVPAIVLGQVFYRAFRGIHGVELPELRETVWRVLHDPSAVATESEAVAALAAMYAASEVGWIYPPFSMAEAHEPGNVSVIADLMEAEVRRALAKRAQRETAGAVAGGAL